MAAAALVCPAGHAFDATAGARFCPACGLPLTLAAEPVGSISDAAHRARKVSPQYGEGKLVKVGWARNQAEAEFLAGMLLEEGVPSVIKRGIGVDVPDFLAAGPRDILVAESGVDVARDVLRPVWDRPPPVAEEPRRAARPLWVRGLAALLAAVLLAVAVFFALQAAFGW